MEICDDHLSQQVSSMKDSTPVRPWRVIAAEISQESNPERFTDLCRELESALDQQTLPKKEAAPTWQFPNRKIS